MRAKFPQALGRYVLLRPLGQGGMGAVYLALSGHRDLETVCVVKRLLPEFSSQPQHVRRFRHEADLARRLAHSNLVSTHNIGEVDGEVFLVQEFVEGQDVSELLGRLGERGRSLPVPIAVHIASEIARGLSYVHAFENLQLVHRDINQPNVRLTYAGEVKLLDFGVASSRLHGERSGRHDVLGKLWHLAPEQVRPGGHIDCRTDIYAVGVLLWELLAGRPIGTTRIGGREGRLPETEGEVMVWITRGEHQAPSAFNPQVPPDLDELVARAMHLDPDRRPSSADELRRALMPFLASDLQPEQELSRLMKDLFSPEQERNERQRLVETGRHLLLGDETSSREMRGLESAVRRWLHAGSTVLRKHATWLVPVAAGAVLGLLCLLYLGRGAGEEDASSPDAAAAGRVMANPVKAPALPSPIPESSAVRASEPPPKLQVQPSGAKEIASSGRALSAASTATASSVQAPPTAAASGSGLPTTSQQSATAFGKADHLQLAREAFDRRDWPRALVEGQSAVAGGGGAEAHALLGSTYFKMGRFADAEKSYARAAALDPKSPLLQERLRIARARAQQGAVSK